MSVEKVNIFLEHVYNKRKYSITGWVKYKLFVRKIVRSSPGFGFFWQVADFIKDAEMIFFYNNSADGTPELFSSRSFKAGENGFKFHCTEFDCTIKLFSDDMQTAIEIHRNVGSKLKSTYLCDDKEWHSDFDKSDELMMDYVIDKIMGAVANLLTWCYKKRNVYR